VSEEKRCQEPFLARPPPGGPVQRPRSPPFFLKDRDPRIGSVEDMIDDPAASIPWWPSHAPNLAETHSHGNKKVPDTNGTVVMKRVRSLSIDTGADF